MTTIYGNNIKSEIIDGDVCSIPDVTGRMFAVINKTLSEEYVEISVRAAGMIYDFADNFDWAEQRNWTYIVSSGNQIEECESGGYNYDVLKIEPYMSHVYRYRRGKVDSIKTIHVYEKVDSRSELDYSVVPFTYRRLQGISDNYINITIPSRPKYSITYILNMPNMEEQVLHIGTAYFNEDYRIQELSSEYEEVEFNGWNTKSDGSGDWYSPNGITIFDSDVTLYAIWGSDQIEEIVEG